MITIKRTNERAYCDNCNRIMSLIMKYEFNDKPNIRPYVILHLCEDCSGALSRLHMMSMEDGCSFKYDMDEIIKIE